MGNLFLKKTLIPVDKYDQLVIELINKLKTINENVVFESRTRYNERIHELLKEYSPTLVLTIFQMKYDHESRKDIFGKPSSKCILDYWHCYFINRKDAMFLCYLENNIDKNFIKSLTKYNFITYVKSSIRLDDNKSSLGILGNKIHFKYQEYQE